MHRHQNFTEDNTNDALVSVIKDIQKRLDDAVDIDFAETPLIFLALNESILPHEQYDSLEEADLTVAACGGNAYPLLILWIRRYYERCPGGGRDIYSPDVLGARSGGALANIKGWKSMLKSRYAPAYATPLRNKSLHILCREDSKELRPWMRGQCWVLNVTDNDGKGGGSCRVKNNTLVYQCIERHPELEEGEFEELLETDGCSRTLEKNKGIDYVRWLWENESRRALFISSLRALAGKGDEPAEDNWLHKLWKKGVNLDCRATWRLCLNGADDSGLRLAFDITDDNRTIIRSELHKAGLELLHGYYLTLAGNMDKLSSVGGKNSCIELPELGDGILFFSIRSDRDLRTKSGVFSEWCSTLTHTRSLWVTHREADHLNFSVNGLELRSEACVVLQNPFSEGQGKYVAELLNLKSWSDDELAGQALSVHVNGELRVHKKLLLYSNVEWGDEWMRGVYEVEADTYRRKSSNTQFICGDRVEILNPECWEMEENNDVALLREENRCWVVLQKEQYTKPIHAYFVHKDGKKRRKSFCFMPLDWLSGEHLVPCRRQKIQEMVPNYQDSRPTLVTRYSGYGRKMTFLRELTAPLLYWSTQGTHEEDYFETREDFSVLDKGTPCRVGCVMPVDALTDAVVEVRVNGDQLVNLRYTRLAELNSLLQKKGALPGCKLGLSYMGEGGKQLLFNGYWTPNGCVLTQDLQLYAGQWPQSLRLTLEHEQCCTLPTVQDDCPLLPITLTLQAPEQGHFLSLAPDICEALSSYPAGYVKVCINGQDGTACWDGTALTDEPLPALEERWQSRLHCRSLRPLKAGLRLFAQTVPALASELELLDTTSRADVDPELLDFFVSPESLTFLTSLGDTAAVILDARMELTTRPTSWFNWGGTLQLWVGSKAFPVHSVSRNSRGYEYSRDNSGKPSVLNICVNAVKRLQIMAQRAPLSLKPHGEYEKPLAGLTERVACCIPVHTDQPVTISSDICLQALAELLPLMPYAGALVNRGEGILTSTPAFASGAGSLIYYLVERLSIEQALLLTLACYHYHLKHLRPGEEENKLGSHTALKLAFDLAMNDRNMHSYSRCCNLIAACFTYFAQQA